MWTLYSDALLIWEMAGHSLLPAHPKTHEEVKALPGGQALTVHAVRGQI